MSDSEQAAACPWCGEHPDEIETDTQDGDGTSARALVLARVSCACGVSGPWSIPYDDEDDAASEAVNVWNEVADA